MITKIIQIRLININGLANIDKVWKLFHYFVVTRTDIICIQEIERLKTLEEHPKLKKSIIYCWDGMERTNGVGIIINHKRFEVIDKLLRPQLIIQELRDIMYDQTLIVANISINPTQHRSKPNKIILEELAQTLSITLINNMKIIIWGDFNHEIKNSMKLLQKSGLKWSYFDYTIPQSRNELDLIAIKLW